MLVLEVFLQEILIAKSGKNEGEEVYKNIAAVRNEFDALKSLVDKHMYNNEATTFEELAQYRRETLDKINEIAERLGGKHER